MCQFTRGTSISPDGRKIKKKVMLASYNLILLRDGWRFENARNHGSIIIVCEFTSISTHNNVAREGLSPIHTRERQAREHRGELCSNVRDCTQKSQILKIKPVATVRDERSSWRLLRDRPSSSRSTTIDPAHMVEKTLRVPRCTTSHK